MDSRNAVGLIPAFLIVGATCALAAEPTQSEKIEAAIARVEKSGLVFIRNGSEYTATEGAKHLRDKLRAAGGQIKTFDDFVEKVASKSSISGKPYLVKFKDGKTQELEKWLREEMNRGESATSKPSANS